MVQDTLKKLYTLAPKYDTIRHHFVVHIQTSSCQISYTCFVLETSIFLPPPPAFFQNISTSLSSRSQEFHQNGSQC